MFENVGKIVKNSASMVLIIGIILSFLNGFMATDNIFIFIVYITIGILFSWIMYVLIYGLGHHIETTDKILEKLSHDENKNVCNIPITFPNETKEETHQSCKEPSTKENTDYNNEITTQIVDKMIEGKKNTLAIMYKNAEITKAEYEECLKELENRTV